MFYFRNDPATFFHCRDNIISCSCRSRATTHIIESIRIEYRNSKFASEIDNIIIVSCFYTLLCRHFSFTEKVFELVSKYTDPDDNSISLYHPELHFKQQRASFYKSQKELNASKNHLRNGRADARRSF